MTPPADAAGEALRRFLEAVRVLRDGAGSPSLGFVEVPERGFKLLLDAHAFAVAHVPPSVRGEDARGTTG